tara:strand:+ start:150 stop:395 length:246 start_codon:yes stop_codon:yes gene_type:complete
MNITNVVNDIINAPVDKIIGEMVETLDMDKQMDDVVKTEVAKLSEAIPAEFTSVQNTQRKQVSTVTSRKSIRRQFKAGFRP